MAKINIAFADTNKGGSHNASIKLAAQVATTGECADTEVDRVNKAIADAKSPKTGRMGARKFVALLDGTTQAAVKYPASIVPGWGRAALKTEGLLTAEEAKWVQDFLVKGQGDEEEKGATA